MRNITNYLLLVLFTCFTTASLSAQNVVSGKVTDSDTGEDMIGASIYIKGTVKGTISGIDGTYKLTSNVPVPYTLVFSLVGYETKEFEVTQTTQIVDMSMGTEAFTFGSDIVVSASRVEEKILESPVTIEKLDIIGIRSASSADYYDEINKLKGVHCNMASMTFNTINTRGFATAGNTRFVQLMDGMDNASPLLNFPTGNVVGISELDIRSVELVPGAASALYGPNAFNGILLMESKSPFDYPGLSAQIKVGQTNSDAIGSKEPLGRVSIRYAKPINDKWAFKMNFSAMSGNDWKANDYTTDRNDETRQPGHHNFDGLNTYGDETEIPLPIPLLANQLGAALAPLFGGDPAAIIPIIQQIDPIAIRRTGIKEEDLLDNRKAQSLKGDVALHYRINDNLEASYNYRIGRGSSVYQGSERYALRDFQQTFQRLELKGNNFFIRGYTSQTDDGDSYNLTALGAFANEAFSPTSSEWALGYAGVYVASYLGTVLDPMNPVPLDQITSEHIAAFHQNARITADATRPGTTTDRFGAVVENVRSGLFQRGGAGFIDDSKLWHAEFQYDMSSLLDGVVDVQIGGNWRTYDLFTDGTIFNEDPDGTGTNERITIDEWGGYLQASKKLVEDRLKLTGSVRYDKNENFDGQFSPRVSLVYSAGANRNHNIRASYQTGFRNPTTQGQYIYFPTTNILLGSTPANAERYGIFNGGAYTEASYNNFRANGGFIDPETGTILVGDESLLETIDLDFIAPEELSSFEVGYKGVIANKLMLDIHGYYNIYNNFISQFNVISKEPTTHKGNPIGAATTFRPYSNATEEITSTGYAIGLTYKLYGDWEVMGNASFATVDSDDEDFETGFNTPEQRFTVGINNRKIWKNMGFGVTYRWQDEMVWESSFANGIVPAYGVLDAMVSFKLNDLKSTIKAGVNNILNEEYRTNIGNPFIGQMIFVSITYDEFAR